MQASLVKGSAARHQRLHVIGCVEGLRHSLPSISTDR